MKKVPMAQKYDSGLGRCQSVRAHLKALTYRVLGYIDDRIRGAVG